MKNKWALALFSFLFAGFLGSWALAREPVAAATAADSGKDKEEPSTRVKIPTWKFTSIFEGVADLRDFDEQAQKEAARKIRADASKAQRDFRQLGDIFTETPFDKMEKLAKDRKISPEVSQMLAARRREAIAEAMTRAIQAVDPQKKLTIGILDSGNKNSGIASDVDQTIFVMPRELAKEMGVDEGKVIAEFNRHFQDVTGQPAKIFGIESMRGNDLFPDWRQKHTVAEFAEEMSRVVDEKRQNPDLYRSEGELKSQVEGRHYEALRAHHERVADLRSARDKIEDIQSDRKLSPEERQARVHQARAELCAKYNVRTLADMEKEIRRFSPWTEVEWDKNGRVVVSSSQDPKNRVLTAQPEMSSRFAYDGAWDNWLMWEHNRGNRRKYLLRALTEGASLLRRPPEGRRVTPFDYERFFAQGRNDLCERLFHEVFPALEEEKRSKFLKAANTAARERLSHKGIAAPSGGPWSPREIYQDYWPMLSEDEAKLYEGMNKKSVDAMLLDRAMRAWEVDARELMIETLLRTVQEPAKILTNGLSHEEFERIRKEYPYASREKLKEAVQKQLYNSIRDLISVEHAKQLTAPPELRDKLKPRQRDLVDRLLERLSAHPETERMVRDIARSAATGRMASEPGQDGFRVMSFYEAARDFLSSKWNSAEEVYRKARANYQSGRYTKEVVANRLMMAYAERWGAVKAQIAERFGFNVKGVSLLVPEKGMPKVRLEYEAQEFDSRKLFVNMASKGNLDSVAQVVLAYQQAGPEAAAWAAAYEVAMNVPGVAPMAAVYDLAVNRRARGLVMLGAAMFIPGMGQTYIVVSLTKTTVAILGKYVYGQLGDDSADMLYQGYLDEARGFKGVVASKRASLLHRVPLLVVVVDDKKISKITGTCTFYHRHSLAEMQEFTNITPLEYEKFIQDGIFGGGEYWEKFLAEASDEINHPKEHFQMQRCSMYYYFKDKIKLPAGMKISDQLAFPHLVEFFLKHIDDWVNARGDFEGFEENVIISRKFEDPQLRQKIAQRAANDLLLSHSMVKSIEGAIDTQLFDRRQIEERMRINKMILAQEDGWRQKPDSRLGHAVYKEVDARRRKGREPAARIHVRPRVTQAKPQGRGKARAAQGGEQAGLATGEEKDRKPVEMVDFFISVVADPEDYPPLSMDGESTAYDVAVDWKIQPISKTEKKVSATVTVFGKGKKVVQKEENIPIGIVGKPAVPEEKMFVQLVEDRNYEKLPLFKERRPVFLELSEPTNLPQLAPFKEKPELLSKIGGFYFYRKYETPQPEEDLRFNRGEHSLDTTPLSSDPDALIKVSGKDKTDRIGVWMVDKPYVSWEQAVEYSRRPWDPGNPLPPRLYSYSILFLRKEPANRNLPDKDDFEEGPLAPWVRCETRPMIATDIHDPDKKRLLSDAPVEMEFTSGLVFDVAAVVHVSGEPVVQKYFLDYQKVLPDRRRKYLYRVDFGDHSRYALAEIRDPENAETTAFVRGGEYYRPGVHEATVSIEVDRHKLSTPLRLVVPGGKRWDDRAKNYRETIGKKTKEIQHDQEVLQQNLSPQDRGGIYDRIASSYQRISEAYTNICEFQEAENNALQGVEYKKRAIEAGYFGDRDPDLHLNYRNLAKVYLGWGRPAKYIEAREAQIATTGPRYRDGLWSTYQDIALEYLSISGDIAVARHYYERAIANNPPGISPMEMPGELKEIRASRNTGT